MVGRGLAASLVLSSLGLTYAVVDYTTARGEAADRLQAANTVRLASLLDELAISTLKSDAGLRDEDSMEAILEDIDDEVDLIEEALEAVQIRETVNASITDTIETVEQVVNSNATEPTSVSDVFVLSQALLADSTSVISTTIGQADSTLIDARETIAAHVIVSAQLLTEQSVTEAEYNQNSASVSETLQLLSDSYEPSLFDPEVELTWAGELDSEAFDHLSELLASVDHALTLHVANSSPQADATAVWVMATLTVVISLAGAVVAQASHRDRLRREQELGFRARHDSLTGLLNRSQIDTVLHEAHEQDGPTVGVLYVDVDHFKTINDTLGHHIGDLVLCKVAKRLVTVLKPTDNVVRLGGDEFVVVVGGLRNPDDIVGVAHRIIEVLAHPLLLEEQPVTVGVSVGAALSNSPNDDVETVLRAADAALYAAKEAGRGRVVAAWSLETEKTITSIGGVTAS